MSPAQRLTAVTGLLTFCFMGAIQALYGPLLPALQSRFGIDAAAAGVIFSAHGGGALAGILLPDVMRVLGRAWLALATALVALGALVIALAPSWPVLLSGACVLALGFGIHVVRLNSLFITGFGARSATMSQLLNAAFSIGSVIGPLVLGVGAWAYPGFYGGIIAVSLALLPLCAMTDRRASAAEPASPARTPHPWQGETLLLLCAFAGLMSLAVGAENAIAGWMTSIALARGLDAAQGASMTAVLFGLIFLGRLFSAGFAHRMAARRLVLLALTFLCALLTISAATRCVVPALVLCGLAIAPLFAGTLAWLAHTMPDPRRANAPVIAGALTGSALFPWLVGRIIGHWGIDAAPGAILVIGLAALGLALAIRARTHSRTGEPRR
jgi:fucose permease